MTDRALVTALVAALEDQAAHLEETACTCASNADRHRYHAAARRRRDSRCRGVQLAVQYRSLAQRTRRRLARRETL